MVFRIWVYQPKNVGVQVDQELCSHKSLFFVNALELHPFLHIFGLFSSPFRMELNTT